MGLAIVGASSLGAPAAHASQQQAKPDSATSSLDPAADNCRDNIAKLRSGAEAKAKGISPDQAVDFYCLGSTASVSPKGDQSRAVTSESLKDQGLKPKSDSMTTEAWYGDYWVNALPGEDPKQAIADDYTSSVAGSFYYGQDSPGTANDWIRAVDMMLDLNLKTTYHDFRFGWNTSVGPWDEKITVNGWVQLQKNEGIAEPKPVDPIFFNNSTKPETSFLITGGLEQPAEGGVYSVEVKSMQVTNQAKAFTIKLKGSMAVPRFLCNYPEQCKYPDGKEAPIFG